MASVVAGHVAVEALTKAQLADLLAHGEFSRERNGYNRQEVDALLQALADKLASIEAQQASLNRQTREIAQRQLVLDEQARLQFRQRQLIDARAELLQRRYPAKGLSISALLDLR